MLIFEILKSILLGIVEGITEWLPVSSTGHLLLFNNLIPYSDDFVDHSFLEMLVEVMQLGAIVAVVIIFWNRLFPFSKKKSKEERKSILALWGKIIVAVIPGGIAVVALKLLGFDLPDNPIIIASALVVYGVLFIIIERLRKNKSYIILNAEDIDYKTAFFIGCFQVLSIVPGTSRSGSTIIGAMTLGVSRTAAADFSFFLAIPAMIGASGISVLSYVKDIADGEVNMPGLNQAIILGVATIVSFVVSFFAVKFLVNFVKKHSFETFGWYRITLGIIIILYFVLAQK